ncbi:hypothetical protein AB1Y20_004843 [Prymnesium parvum]|uniref:N-alpha-acetyltransferase 60 n=1 Tax=Prymnesium parvum TaxID=97485 RepID=A0AB34J0C2_PRYPA
MANPTDDLEQATSAESIVFRDLQLADVPAVKALHRDLFPVQYSDSFFNNLFNTGYYCLVGIVNGEIVAVASARTVEPNGKPSREAYIMTLGVREDHRRRNLGSASMVRIIELLRERTECETAVLHVKLLNKAAVNFYHKNGFHSHPIEGLCRDHYYIEGKHYDALLFKRDLHSGLFGKIKSYCALL